MTVTVKLKRNRNVSTLELNFGWLHESTPQVDSNLLCGMFSAGNTDLSGTTDSSGTLHGALHRPVAFDYGLQGVEVEGDAEVPKI